MTETDLYEQVEQYLRLKHPDVPHHWDLSGLWTPSHKQRNLYGRLNQRAFPDLVIYKPVGKHAGLALELKREGTQLYKKDGTLRANLHHFEQAAVLEQLRRAGYAADFAVGYDETIAKIEAYLNPAQWTDPGPWTSDEWPVPESICI